MENLKTLKSIEIPNLEVKPPQKNHIKNLNYYSFEERVFDLANLLKESLDEKSSKVIGANVYISRKFRKNYDGSSPIFNGVYKLDDIENYMGFIPEKNQLEIKTKFESLINNPFLNHEFKLMVLAPLNNFAEENNIKAIDPIAFAYFKEGEHSNEKNCLITLSQWI